MPFLKGVGALRRTQRFLEKGSIILRDDVKVLTFSVAAKWDGHGMGQSQLPEEFKHHDGLYKFLFWHLPQLQYKNPEVQMLTFRKLTPTPWVKAYFEDDTDMLIDCDSRSREQIHDHLKSVLGKSEHLLREEMRAEETFHNPANMGEEYARQCICEVPGQIPCPGFTRLPKEMTGKYRLKMKQEQE